MDGISDIKKDLPMSMTMAAFTGIAWYICIELNIRLFILFKRRKGLYFWSCVLCSWGINLQPLTIIMTDFAVWTDLKVSVSLIYLSWCIMVVPQSLVLYSRLHLVMLNSRHLKWVLYIILFNAVVFSIPTIIIGVLAQATTYSTTLAPLNLIWDRIQVTAFLLQETLLSILYILETRKHLKDSSLLNHNRNSSNLGDRNRQILHQLIYTNLLVIFLDVTLLGIQYANLFYLQGAYKPCVYGVKLRVEFAILNRLINSVQERGSVAGHSHGTGSGTGRGGGWRSTTEWRARQNETRLETFSCQSQTSGAPMLEGVGGGNSDHTGKSGNAPADRHSIHSFNAPFSTQHTSSSSHFSHPTNTDGKDTTYTSAAPYHPPSPVSSADTPPRPQKRDREDKEEEHPARDTLPTVLQQLTPPMNKAKLDAEA